MSNTVMKGNGYKLKGWRKLKFDNLTYDDLLNAESEEDELLGRLEKEPEKSKEKVEQLMSDM